MDFSKNIGNRLAILKFTYVIEVHKKNKIEVLDSFICIHE